MQLEEWYETIAYIPVSERHLIFAVPLLRSTNGSMR